LDRLPPTIKDTGLLALLGNVLEAEPTSQSTGALRLRSFQPGFSWQALVDLAIVHDVLPPLVFALTQRGLLPPVPQTLREEARAAHVTTRLSAAYQQHLERQADLREQLKTVTAALNSHGVIPVLLKGSVHLTKTQPRWHEARGMRDLDILVGASEAEGAYRILLSLGYAPDRDPPPLDRHLPELRLPRRAGAVEVHTEALSFLGRHALTTEETFARAEPHAFEGTKLQMLSGEWHLLHGLLHHQLADRGHARRILAIKGLWEFSRVGAEVATEGWRAIIDHAEKGGLLDVLSSWAIQANRLFGLGVPSDLLEFEPGQRHAEATFRHAGNARVFRQAGFTADRLRLAFAPKTLAARYRAHRGGAPTAMRHLGFLLRRRAQAIARVISVGDVRDVARLGTFGVLAWTLPEAMWAPITRSFGRLRTATHPRRTRSAMAQIASLLSPAAAGSDPLSITIANAANRYEAQFQYLRSWRPGGWNPQIDLLGTSHVSDALDRGNGVVLWGGTFSFNSLVAKMAMHQLGLAVSGFSVPSHGFSNTHFGVRYLNRVCRDIEDRYLGERLMVEGREFAGALQHLRGCLKANKVIYFAVGGRGRQTAAAKILDGQIIVATGPLFMAHQAGAAVLPVHTFRKAPGHFKVIFGPPIDFQQDSNGKVDYGRAVQAYADALVPFVQRDPGQWWGWHLTRSWDPW
jgi:lauroyl/myristoyl acyltransferase